MAMNCCGTPVMSIQAAVAAARRCAAARVSCDVDEVGVTKE